MQKWSLGRKLQFYHRYFSESLICNKQQGFDLFKVNKTTACCNSKTEHAYCSYAVSSRTTGEVFVGTRPCSKCFSFGSPPSRKPTLSNSYSIGNSEGHMFVSRKNVKCNPPKIKDFIYLFIYPTYCWGAQLLSYSSVPRIIFKFIISN